MTVLNFKIVVTLFIICNIFSLMRVIYGKATEKNIPRIFRGVYVTVHIMLLVCCIAEQITGYTIRSQGLYTIAILLVTCIVFSICISYSLKLNEMQRWIDEQRKLSGYKKVTGKALADYLGIEYISKIQSKKEVDRDIVNSEIKDNIIEFFPLNGIHYSKKFVWKDEKIYISNASNFKGIVNLVDILDKMVSIYKMSVENNIFINPYSFGLKLSQVGNEKYSAKLIMQDETVLNWKIEPYERKKYKKKLLSDFLLCFIGYNFGSQMQDSGLKNSTLELVKIAKEKELLAEKRERKDCIYNTYVKTFKF